MYKLQNSYVIRQSDGALIPPDENNADWRDYLAWCVAGNAAEPADQSPGPMVSRVTAAQAKLALLNAGLLDQVTAATSADQAMKIFFDNAPYWDIDHPYVKGLAAGLGLSDEAIAALFASAARL